MTPGDRFTCQKCVELLREFLDNELPGALQSSLEQHLGGCEMCTNFVNTYRASSRCAQKRLIADELPPELANSVHVFFKGKIPGF